MHGRDMRSRLRGERLSDDPSCVEHECIKIETHTIVSYDYHVYECHWDIKMQMGASDTHKVNDRP
jgi:hypothetical protein